MYRPETAFLVAEWERMNEEYKRFEEFMKNVPTLSCNEHCEKCISVCEKRKKDTTIETIFFTTGVNA